MNIVSYFNPDTLERDNDGNLGLLTETITDGLKFFPIESDEFDIWVNGYHGIKSFSLHIDNGTCTFSKEFRKSGDRLNPYWYASKRVNGKLKRLYFGTEFTKDRLNQIVDKLQVKQEVTQEVTQAVCNEFSLGDKVLYTNPKLPYEKQRGIGEIVGISDEHYYIIWQDDPKMEAPYSRLYNPPNELALAAGHGKSDRHIQPSLMELANDPVKLLTHKNKELERQNKDLNKRLIEALDKTAQRDDINGKLEAMVSNQAETIDRQASLIFILRGDIDKLNHKIVDMERESSKREDDVQGYAYMYEEHSNQIFAYQALIEKYRAMTVGKTKKGNPRYAYLIDFLSDIDKIS
jgi:hypothetical protein